MRIGMAQMDISWENIEDNKKKVEEFFQKAVENQVKKQRNRFIFLRR